jgi:hypothetical protein
VLAEAGADLMGALEDLAARFGPGSGAILTTGEITATSPLTVQLDGTTDIPTAQTIDSYIPTVADVVAVLVQGTDLLVLGVIGIGVPGSVGGPPDTWHVIGDPGEPAFQNNWAPAGASADTPMFRKVNDIVFLNGSITPGIGTTPVDEVVFTLPVGYRPLNPFIFAPYSDIDGAHATDHYIYVEPSGDVFVTCLSGFGAVSTYFCFSGVTFPADN